MRIKYDIDPVLRPVVDKGNVMITAALPRAVVVNKFTEDSAKQFRAEFAAAIETGQKVLPVIIDSYGGLVHSLLSMIDTIKASPIPVATIATGKAMSCGAVLLTCGADGMRYASKHATIMIHDVAGGTRGKVGDMEISVKESKRLNKLIYKIMEENVGMKSGSLHALVEKKNRHDWYLTAKTALKHGIVNHVGAPTLTLSITTETIFE